MSVLHTPGPWHVAGPIPGLFNDCKVIVADGFDDAVVCVIGHDIPGDEANARLIAAAPELLAALRYVLSENPHYCASPLVHAAIAKAEGR